MYNFNTDYFGDQTRWFIGVVEEDANDPLGLGRVRVRMFGLHSPFTDDIPFDQLPWANIVIPTTEGGFGGTGVTPNGLKKGAFVFGIFLDGEQSQQPLVIGVIPKQEVVPKVFNAQHIRPASVDAVGATQFTTSSAFNVKLDGNGQPMLDGTTPIEKTVQYAMDKFGLSLNVAIGIAASLFYGTSGDAV